MIHNNNTKPFVRMMNTGFLNWNSFKTEKTISRALMIFGLIVIAGSLASHSNHISMGYTGLFGTLGCIFFLTGLGLIIRNHLINKEKLTKVLCKVKQKPEPILYFDSKPLTKINVHRCEF